MHFLQSKYWKECKNRLGNKIIPVGEDFLQITKLKFGFSAGYLPRVDINSLNFDSVKEIAQKEKLLFVTIDASNLSAEIPDSLTFLRKKYPSINLDYGVPINPQENFILSLNSDLSTIEKNMDKIHRYSLRVANRNNLQIETEEKKSNLEEFFSVYLTTVKDQGYSARGREYIQTVWDTLKEFEKKENIELIKLFTAKYNNKTVAVAMFFLFNKTIYYAYSGSLREERRLNPNYALIWSVIEWGTKNGFDNLDFMGIKKDKNGNYNGYSKFKLGWGGNIVKYADTVNIIGNPIIYPIAKIFQKLR